MKTTKLFFVTLVSIYSSLASARMYAHERTKGLSDDGLRQTIVSQLMVGPTGEDFEVTAPERVDTKALSLGEDRKFFLKIKHKKDARHLVVIVPGFGQTHSQGPGPYLSEMLNRAGFLTLVSNSPAAPEFIKYSSGPGFPGIQRWDGIDLYDMVVASKKKLESQYKYKIEKISLIGTSLGSMNVAHMLMIERERNPGKPSLFYRVFSCNPPISNAYGSSTIDAMVYEAMADKEKFSYKTFSSSLVKALGSVLGSKLKTTKYETVEANSALMSNELTFTEEELRFLVGFGFQSTVTKALQAMAERNPQDTAGSYITDQLTDLRLFTAFFKGVSFKRWRVVYPLYNDGYGTLENGVQFDYSYNGDSYTMDDESMAFTESESVFNNVEKLQLSNFHLVTWEDDFLLQKDDVKWIQSTFTGGVKGNSKIFKRGGHLGGYYQKEYQQYLLDNLK